jgi:hypothetical protein
MRSPTKKLLLITLSLTGLIFWLSGFRRSTTVTEATQAARTKEAVTSAAVHGIPVSLTEVTANQIKVANSFKIKTPDDLNSYINKRKPQLSNFANTTPTRQIEVVVSPSRRLSLEEFGRKAAYHGMQLDELSLDVFVNDAWDHTVWFDHRTSLVDISEDASLLAKQIIQLESSRSFPPSLSGSSEPATAPSAKVDLAIRYARGRIEALAGTKLQDDPAILLVDPTTDLADEFASQGREVKVHQMPQLYVEKELRWGNTYSNKANPRAPQ